MRQLSAGAYRSLAALAVAVAILATAYLVVPHPLVKYGAWLVVFSVWMVWFVAAAREWIGNADF